MRFAIRWTLLILITSLCMWGLTAVFVHPAGGQEHCVSPAEIREAAETVLAILNGEDAALFLHVSRAPENLSADVLIFVPADEMVQVLGFQGGCPTWAARITEANFRRAKILVGAPA